MKKKMIGGAVSFMLLSAAGAFAVQSMLPANCLETPELGISKQLQAEDALQEVTALYEAELQEKDSEIVELKEQLAVLSEVDARVEEVADVQPEIAGVIVPASDDDMLIEEEDQALMEETPSFISLRPQPQDESAQPLSMESELANDAIFSFEANIVDHVHKLSPGNSQANQQSKSSTLDRALSNLEPVNLTAYAQQVITLTNSQREAVGLVPLKTDSAIIEMAMLRAKELEKNHSHTRPNGKNCQTVFEELETDLKFYGENAAKGQKTPEAVVEAWMDSPDHKKNLLRAGAEYLGVGVWQDTDGILYWVQLFGVQNEARELWQP